MNRKRRNVLIRALLFSTLLILGAVIALHFVDQSWSNRYQEKRESGNQAFMEEGQVEWQGAKYRKKPAMTLIMVGGIDKEDTEEKTARVSYRNGGQADFLLLLGIDHQNRQIHQLQIDRDTMADVTVLGVYGNETGTRRLQICLAHSYGARPEENAKYTVKAVERLLFSGSDDGTQLTGVNIDGYYMVNYSAVPALADALGGVTVKIPVDMTSVNSAWHEGATVTLRGSDAETFVRTRKTVGEGTNQERMSRQNLFMRSATDQMRKKLSQDSGFADVLLKTLKNVATTNFSDQELLNEITESRNYELLPVDYLPGEYILAENGFIEFYCKEGSAREWVMTHLFSAI